MPKMILPLTYDYKVYEEDSTAFRILGSDGLVLARADHEQFARELCERVNEERPEGDWLPPNDVPIDKIVALLVRDRVGMSLPLPTKVVPAFRDEHTGKWKECTTVGNYVLHQEPLAYRELPLPPTPID